MYSSKDIWDEYGVVFICEFHLMSWQILYSN